MKPKNRYINKKWLLLVPLVFLGGFLLFANQSSAAAGINRQINFQGKVVNTDGTNVTNGSYNFLLCLYTTASPATACTSGANNDAVWRESKSLTVTNGIFQTDLGYTTTLPGSVDFNTDNIYLGVNFNSNGQMSPLIRFTAAPYAMNADKVHGLTVTDTTGTLTVANGKTVSFADAFSTSGAFPLTLTATASTTATLPSGTITLADTTTSQVLTNKTIGSTGLVFSGAATDITTASGEDLVIVANGAGIVDVQDGLQVNSLNVDTGNVIIAGGSSYTGAGAVTLSSGGSSGLTINSASGVTTIATGDYLALSHSGVSGAAAGYIWYDSSDNKFKINENGTTKILCNTTDAGCGTGGSSDLQTTYGNDADGGNVTISLTAADDGLVFTNPTSGGNDLSSFLLQLSQANTTAAVVALDIVQSSNAANGANIAANAIDTETALAVTANGLTSGKGLTVNSSSTGLTSSGDVASITLSGSNASNAGDVLSISNTGSLNTNISLHIDHQATGTNNLAVRVDDVSGDTTPFVIDGAGNVGIGTAAPSRVLDVVQAASAPQLRLSKDLTNYSEFTVDSVGDLQIAATGTDIRALSENLWICDNDACPALTLTGDGNIFVENVLKFGNGVYFKNDSATELGVYDSNDQAMLIFDQL